MKTFITENVKNLNWFYLAGNHPHRITSKAGLDRIKLRIMSSEAALPILTNIALDARYYNFLTLSKQLRTVLPETIYIPR